MTKSKIIKSPIYEVESILERKGADKSNDLMYRIKWIGYPESKATWEPMKNLKNVKELISKFDNKNQNGKSEIEKNENKTKVKKRIRKIAVKKINQEKVLKLNQNNYEEIILDSSVSDVIDSNEQSPNLKNKINKRGILVISKPTNKVNSQQKDEENGNFLQVTELVSGNNLNDDIPVKILSARIKNNKEISCLVKWKSRKDGVIPEPSFVSNVELKMDYISILTDFYETRLVFPRYED